MLRKTPYKQASEEGTLVGPPLELEFIVPKVTEAHLQIFMSWLIPLLTMTLLGMYGLWKTMY